MKKSFWKKKQALVGCQKKGMKEVAAANAVHFHILVHFDV